MIMWWCRCRGKQVLWPIRLSLRTLRLTMRQNQVPKLRPAVIVIVMAMCLCWFHLVVSGCLINLRLRMRSARTVKLSTLRRTLGVSAKGWLGASSLTRISEILRSCKIRLLRGVPILKPERERDARRELMKVWRHPARIARG